MESLKGKQYWPLAVCGASGAGKGTVVKTLIQHYPHLFELSVSLTTRAPRVGEVNNREYEFVTKEQFEKDIEKGIFAEYCLVHGNYYGTSKNRLQTIIDNDKICLLDIDVQGAKKIHDNTNANFIWLDVPSFEELQKRLVGRGTDTKEVIEKRIKNAKEEIAQAYECKFYHYISNDKWENTWNSVKQYLKTCYPDANI